MCTPTYPAPGVGFVRACHARYGWGWHHPRYGWHHGWRRARLICY